MSNEKQFQAMQQFRFQEQFQAVRSMVDQSGEPWFVAMDVCDILGISNSRDALLKLDDDERDDVGVTDAIGRVQQTNIVNESGLYNLIFRSDKPQAKVFRKWVTSEVLPAIRKQGYYGFMQKTAVPADPEQAWAMWAYLARHKRVLAAQLRSISQMQSACLARVQDTAPLFQIPEPTTTGLFP